VSDILFSGRIDIEESYIWDVSIDKAKTELEYSPKYTIDDAIADQIRNSKT
jgi:nucleoside-diphosphate-sugar epimerase